MPPTPIPTIIMVLRRRGGIIALAANELGVTRQALDQRIKRNRILRQALREIEDQTLDIAEAGLMSLVAKGDPASVRFYLTTKGKRRGYSSRTEVTGKNGRSLDPVNSIPDITDDQAKLIDQLARLSIARRK